MDIDDLLTASAPPTAPRSEELRTATRAMVDGARPTRSPGRRLRTTLVSALAVGLVGGGVITAGAASNWFGFGATAEKACAADFSFLPKGIDGEAGTPTYPQEVEDRAVAASQAFYSSYDFDAIDRDAAAERAREAERLAIASSEPGEQQPVSPAEEHELQGVTMVFMDDWKAHLDSLGIPWQAALVSVSWNCES